MWRNLYHEDCYCICLWNGNVIIFPYRLLQISSFNGKMNALNEVNKVIASVTYYPHRHTGLEEEEWLTAERMAVSNTVCWSCHSSGSYLLVSNQFPGTRFCRSTSGLSCQLFHQCSPLISHEGLVQWASLSPQYHGICSQPSPTIKNKGVCWDMRLWHHNQTAAALNSPPHTSVLGEKLERCIYFKEFI
jgi:hypothetical protein